MVIVQCACRFSSTEIPNCGCKIHPSPYLSLMFVKYLSVHLAVGCTKHGLMLLVYVENTSIHRTVGIKMALFALEINLVGSRKPAI